MNIGITNTSQTVVNKDNVALAMGSGGLQVFATPSMIALMENAAYNAVQVELSEYETTVGISIKIDHTRPSAMNERIEAKATLTEIDGKKLTFSVSASDSKGLIGEGIHQRYIVNTERFLSKL
jgi:fluoroacetyl-CoA thioesterase